MACKVGQFDAVELTNSSLKTLTNRARGNRKTL